MKLDYLKNIINNKSELLHENKVKHAQRIRNNSRINTFRMTKHELSNFGILNANTYEEDVKVDNSEEVSNEIIEDVIDSVVDEIETIQEVEPILIGITGTVAKTSIAYILHNYLKKLGKRSVLVSSASIDIPTSYIDKNFSVQAPVMSEADLINHLNDSLDYKAEIIIIEVTLESFEYFENLEFDIKILSTFWDGWRLPDFSRDEYFEMKSAFFKKDNSVNFILANANRVNDFVDKCNNVYLFGDKAENLYSEIIEFERSLDYQKIKIKCADKIYDFETSMLFDNASYNTCCVIAVLEYLNLMNQEVFKEFIKDFEIPGRAQKIIWKNRTIVITLNYLNEILSLKDFKDNKVKVLTGISGYSRNLWHDSLTRSDERLEIIKKLHRLIPSFVDTVYYTNRNPGQLSEEDLEITTDKVFEREVVTIFNREECIRKMLEDSEENDILFISGRANMREYVVNNTHYYFTDEDIVNKIINESEVE